MNRHFVIITVETDVSDLTQKLRARLDRAVDWIELTPTSWLLWTSTTSNGWLKRIRLSDIKFDSIFISEINPSDRAGLMPDQVWNFIRKRHSD